MIRLAPLALLATLALGCGHLEVSTVLLRAPEAPRTPAVRVYFPKDRVARPYYDVAMLQVQAAGVTMGDVMDALTHRAHLLGCDALVRTQIAVGAGRLNGVAVCVRFTDDASTTAAAPAPVPASAPPDAADL
jgi:hypothetical protein